jgi:S-adenosylmethionine hydrolase
MRYTLVVSSAEFALASGAGQIPVDSFIQPLDRSQIVRKGGMILTVTDFGAAGPYLAQMHAAALRRAPEVPVLDLVADLPAFQPLRSGYLLAALAPEFPTGSVFCCVVDPGVGSERAALIVQAGGRWFVGPDNGLLAIVAQRDPAARVWTLDWRPERLSASFHGRDLFMPAAAMLASAAHVPSTPADPRAMVGADAPPDLAEVVYIDAYVNAMTGLRADPLPVEAALLAGDRQVPRARTFADVAPGTPLWYANSSGLAEIAVNQGRADRDLGLSVSAPVTVQTSESGDA